MSQAAEPSGVPQRAHGLRALVTGGSQRVGRAIALALARAGCDVDITYRASREHAESLVDELASAGADDPRALPLDLTDLDSVQRFAAEYASVRTSLAVLVHNASAYGPTPMGAIDAARAESLMRVHAVGPLLLTQGLLGPLRAPGSASVVAMLDIHAMGQPRTGYSAYAMSKAALRSMVESLAVELAPSIRVNGVAPGVVLWGEQGDDLDLAMRERYIQRIPLGRVGTPEEAAQAVVWLALHATYTTGQVVRVDGGRALR
jgi:pteridine reductase